MEHNFFSELLIVLVMATCVAIVFERVKLPTTLGFLLAGIFLGPSGLALISDTERIRALAELGTILLLLSIGIEFTFDRIKGLRRVAIFGGAAQIILSIIIGVVASNFLGWPYAQGLILGSVIALSSTAIVLKNLIDRGEMDTPHGRISVAILVFQDLAFVPLLILTNALGDPSQSLWTPLISAGGKALLFIAAVVLTARWILSPFLHWVAQTRNREIFFLSVIVICLSFAWLGHLFGLSYAIGAFFAGLMLANTPYGHQVTGEIIPFRYVFVSIFFVSIGLLFDPIFFITHLPIVCVVVGLILVVNFLVTAVVVLGFGYPPRVAIASGLILAQIGEFSFLLLEAARTSDRLDPFIYQIFLTAAFVTIFITPFLFTWIGPISRLCEKIPFFGMPPTELQPVAHQHSADFRGHVIICGFGRVGQDLAAGLIAQNKPLVVLDLNSKNIHTARGMRCPAIYGDATNELVLQKAGIGRAKALTVTFSDSIGMMQIVRVAQRLNSEATLIVRTRFERDVAKLYELGADIVVMEELEAGLELNRLLLRHLDVPQDRVEAHLKKIRQRKELAIEQAIFKKTS